MAAADTKDLILDAAEHLFAVHGFDRTSLRQITTEAKVNLAAVNYHFQSKEALLHAVFERRAMPVNSRRLQLLSDCEAEFQNEPIPLESLLQAFIAPVLQHPDIKRFRPLMARLFIESDERTRDAFIAQVVPVLRRFGPAILSAVPGLTVPEMHWRMHFMVGMMSHMLGAEQIIQSVSRGFVDPGNLQQMLPRLVAFAAAGMRSPIATTTTENPIDAIPHGHPLAAHPGRPE